MLSQLEKVFPANSTQGSHPLIATVLYEDLEAGLRARALMECVAVHINSSPQIKLEFWRFDWLAERSLANVALGMARQSALLLIAASSATPLSAATEKWINAWVQKAQARPSALIVLLPRNGVLKRHPLRDQLQNAAQQKQVDFFCEFFDPAGGETDGCDLRHAEHEEFFGPAVSSRTTNAHWEARKHFRGANTLYPDQLEHQAA